MGFVIFDVRCADCRRSEKRDKERTVVRWTSNTDLDHHGRFSRAVEIRTMRTHRSLQVVHLAVLRPIRTPAFRSLNVDCRTLSLWNGIDAKPTKCQYNYTAFTLGRHPPRNVTWHVACSVNSLQATRMFTLLAGDMSSDIRGGCRPSVNAV